MKTEYEVLIRLISYIQKLQDVIKEFSENNIKMDYRNVDKLHKDVNSILSSIVELSWVFGSDINEVKHIEHGCCKREDSNTK